MAMARFSSARALSTNPDPKTESRPFDKNRDGFVIAEGAGIVILEELEHALKRGAKVPAEVVGYGMTGDAYHITAPAPEGEGGARAMQMALDDAGMRPERNRIHQCPQKQGPEYNDKFETAAIKKVFGEHAYQIPVSSTKSMTGHLLGASGAVEAIFSVLAIKESIEYPRQSIWKHRIRIVTSIMFPTRHENNRYVRC